MLRSWLVEEVKRKENRVWNVIRKKIWKDVTALMTHAKEKGSAANVSHTTCDRRNFPVAVFQNQPKQHITDPFPILQSLSNRGKFNKWKRGIFIDFSSVC